MSRTLEIKMKRCSICSAENETAKAGGNPHYQLRFDYDIDGRPARDIFEMELEHELDVCDRCGFVWRDLADTTINKDQVLAIMQCAEWKETLTIDDPLPLPLAIERHTILLDRLSEISLKSARAFLRMAWILDDERNPRRSRVYRRKAIDCFLAYLNKIKDQDGITDSPEYRDNERDIAFDDEGLKHQIYKIVADLYRVSGRFYECMQFIDGIMDDIQSDWIREVLIFTRYKAAINDQGIYKLTDI